MSRFRDLEAARALAAANKRIGNILRKQGGTSASNWQREALVDGAELALAERIEAIVPTAEAHFVERAYERYLESLATLREPVDRFFDEVMVMSEDAGLRTNRLALLAHLHELFGRVADISLLHET